MEDNDVVSDHSSESSVLSSPPLSEPSSPNSNSSLDVLDSPTKAPHKEGSIPSSPLSETHEDVIKEFGFDSLYPPTYDAKPRSTTRQESVASVGVKRTLDDVENAMEDDRIAKRKLQTGTASQISCDIQLGNVMAVSDAPATTMSSSTFGANNHDVPSANEMVISEIMAAHSPLSDPVVAPVTPVPSVGPVEGADSRPNSRASPKIFAYTRHDLSETLKKHYNTYKGSLYSRDGVALGNLLDGFATPLERIGSKVIIGTMGGGRSETGHARFIKPLRTTSRKAYEKAIEKGSEFLVIVGDKNTALPSKPRYPYSVLGWFHVTAVWDEKIWVENVIEEAKIVSQKRTGKDDMNNEEPETALDEMETAPKKGKSYITRPAQPMAIQRFRLERIEDDPWWLPLGGDWVDHDAALDQATDEGRIYGPYSRLCEGCKEIREQIFEQGWACTKSTCEHFFKFFNIDLTEDFLATLRYSDAFLAKRTPWVGGKLPCLVRPIPQPGTSEYTSKDVREGVVCPQCGCANSRIHWDRWECRNPACDWKHIAPVPPPPREVIEAEHRIFMERMKTILAKDNNPAEGTPDIYRNEMLVVGPHEVNFGTWKGSTFFLRGLYGEVTGSITVIQANYMMNSSKYGADERYWELTDQGSDLGLERRHIGGEKNGKSEGLTRHFVKNFGAPYKFVVSALSGPFTQAPRPIIESHHRLKWAAQEAIKESNALLSGMGLHELPSWKEDFNELLTLGYMDQDKIGWHDDGEKELGPTIGTESLGSPSLMHFRPKLHRLNKPSDRFWKEKAFPVGSQLSRIKGGYKEVLTIPLSHGDLVVMHGHGIQQLYDHMVEPYGSYRYALTCRVIKIDQIKGEKNREQAIYDSILPDLQALRLQDP